MKRPELIVMLTHHDRTVSNAEAIFASCKDCAASYWGMKEAGISREQMKNLFCYMKACGKKTVLEVVAYTEKEGLEGACLAHECGCDILMGTVYSDKIMSYCKEHNLQYIPFAGSVTERPSILSGDINDIRDEIQRYIDKGVAGIDLLAYRYTGNANKLVWEIIKNVSIPVCVAGSINSFEQIELLEKAGAWAFTIGGAFFDHCFGDTFADQIENVCAYINMENRL